MSRGFTASAVGAVLTFHARGKERTSEIVALDPGCSITLRSVQGGVSADYVYGLTLLGDDHCEATLSAACNMTGAWRLLGPIIRPAMKRSDSGQMDALKRVVEAS